MAMHSPTSNTVQRLERIFDWLARTGTLVLLAVLGWLGREIYQELRDQAESVERRVYSLEIWQAETKGDRFTAKDWVEERRVLEHTIAGLDKRVARNEDSTRRILEELDKISDKLDRLMGFPDE